MTSKIETIAWMGGSRPAKPSQISAKQAGVQKYIFSQHVVTYRGYWHTEPDWETLRLFFKWARYDAHATCRND